MKFQIQYWWLTNWIKDGAVRSLFAMLALVLALPFREDDRRKRVAGAFLRWLVSSAVLFALCAATNYVLSLLFLYKEYSMVAEGLNTLFVCGLYIAVFSSRLPEARWFTGSAVIAVILLAWDVCYGVGVLRGSAARFLIPGLLLLLFVSLTRACSLERFSTTGSGIGPVVGFNFTAALLAIITLPLTPMPTYLEERQVVLNMLLFYLAMLFFVIATYISVFLSFRGRSAFLRDKMEDRMTAATNEQIELVKTSMRDIRRIQHDRKNQFAYMSALLQEGRLDELEKVLQTYAAISIKPDYYFDFGNLDVTSILNMLSSKAHAQEMSLDCVVVVPPRLPVDSADLCAILANLVDNALEANVRYDCRDPVRVKLHLRQEYLYICVANSVPEDVDGRELLTLQTRKQDAPEQHGFGTDIVLKLAEQYNGFATFDVEDGEFIAEVMLDMGLENEREEEAHE